MIRRLLIANRGEIAIRIARGARELGISPVGVYSDADATALFREALDDAVPLGASDAAASYLDEAKIVAAARTLRADAVHPGYGFLSERASFAQRVVDAGLIFVGPSPAAMAALGSKREAKQLARAAGVPVVPGYDGADQSDDVLRREARALGVPLAIKASAGGGGRGLRVVEDLAPFDEALASARREARAAFGDDTMLLERYVHRPRHIEFQILGDAHGNVVHLGERECSIQRRHQKIVEEAPSVALDDALRERMGGAAVAVARSAAYTNAGTCEFVLGEDGAYFFLEMNARLQVEHPVTELVTGIDLVHEQLRIASGEPLRFRQHDVHARGWSIEVRLTAEDPAHDFAPQSGTLSAFRVPAAPGVRLDAGVGAGSSVPLEYDALLAKIIVWAEDRTAAVRRLAQTLADTHVAGIATNLPLLRAIAGDSAFAAGATTTAYLAERAGVLLRNERARDEDVLVAIAALLRAPEAWRLAGVGIPVALTDGERIYRTSANRTASGWQIEGAVQAQFAIEDTAAPLVRLRLADGRIVAANVARSGEAVEVDRAHRLVRFTLAPPPAAATVEAAGAGSGTVVAPMAGRIISVNAAVGRVVAERELLMVLEAMKMEHRIEAPVAGVVAAVGAAPGDVVRGGAVLLTIAVEPAPAA